MTEGVYFLSSTEVSSTNELKNIILSRELWEGTERVYQQETEKCNFLEEDTAPDREDRSKGTCECDTNNAMRGRLKRNVFGNYFIKSREFQRSRYRRPLFNRTLKIRAHKIVESLALTSMPNASDMAPSRTEV